MRSILANSNSGLVKFGSDSIKITLFKATLTIGVGISGYNSQKGSHIAAILPSLHQALNRAARNRFVADIHGDHTEAVAG